MRINRKLLIWIGVPLGLVLLAVGGAILYLRDYLFTARANEEVHGTIEPVPAPTSEPLPPLTTGPADWICWRGPAGDGRSLVESIRMDWSGGLGKLWEVSFLCQGRTSGTWSAPVVRGNRLIVCGRDADNDLVFCLDPEDGRLLWRASCAAEADRAYGSGARATPWIDEDRVYTFGRSGDLVCWKLADGTRVWHRNVEDEGGEESRWGHSSSPLVSGEVVVVAGGGTARTLAYDKMTGDIRWKAGRGKAGYAAMVSMSIGGRPAVLNFHGTGLAAIDLQNGKELWDTPWTTNYDVNATTPVVEGDRVFITSGYKTGCELLRARSDSVEVVWRSEVIASTHSDPFILDGHLYGYSGSSMQNRGFFRCVELATGTVKWSTDEMGWGTCVSVAGHLLCMDIKGNLFLMRPDPDRFVKVTEMRGALGEVRGAAWTVPVVANGRLYLRFAQRLLCLEIDGTGR